jgi:hypothetical protein
VEEIEMKKLINSWWDFLKGIILIILIIGISWGTWLLGRYFAWDWGSFWSNFISNAGSSAVIGFVLYWIITRPDEKKATDQRRAQALSMLKIEFKTNLQRARLYSEALKSPDDDLTSFYPLRFTRGAWNALKESGFLPQFENVAFVYELLRLNEVIVVANKTLSSVRSAKVGKNMKIKLARSSKKAVKECVQIEAYIGPILAQLEKMNLPDIKIPEDVDDDSNPEEDDIPEGDGENS